MEILLRTNDTFTLEANVDAGGWHETTPEELAEMLTGSQLAHIHETSKDSNEQSKSLKALSIKFNFDL